MATYICASNGLFTGSIWGTVDGTSLLDSEAANTVLTTSYVESATFTPGIITIDGIAVKIATRAASPSGTMSVRLSQAAATVAGTEVTINVADILGSALLQNGWIFFKFSAPVTLAAATAYSVAAKTSASAQVNLYRNATAANWSRMLRTTTNATLTGGDNWFVLGECTAAATMTARAVTMDQTAATDYGGASTTIAGCGIGLGGTITFQANAATNYILQESAVMDIWIGGTLNMGTIGTPCPRDSTMILQFDCAADGDFGLRVWGNLNMQGQSRIVGVTNHYVLLAADAAAAATTATTDSQLSSKSGDEIVFASTTRTVTQAEVRTTNLDAGATSLQWTSGLTNAHSGTTPTQAEVIGVTRAVKIISTSSSFMSYVLLQSGCTVDCDWAEFKFCGSSTAKPAILWAGTAGSVNLNKCVIRDADAYGFNADNASGVGAFTLTDCVFWNCSNVGAGNFIFITQLTTAAYTITGCVVIGKNTSATGIYLNAGAGTLSNCRINSCQTGLRFGMLSSNVQQIANGTFSGNVIHSCNSNGLLIDDWGGGTISSTTIWRTGSAAISLGSVGDILFDGLTIFGGGTQNVSITSSAYSNITFRNFVSNGDSTFATGIGINIAALASRVRIEGSNFSTASGIKTAHGTADIAFPATGIFCELFLVNTTLAASTEIQNSSSLTGRSFIAYQKHEGASGTNRTTYPQLGTVSYDTVTFRTASPSEKLAPSAAVSNFRLETSRIRVAVGSGQSCSISTYGNKSALYNGDAPRVRVKQNSAAGISEATVATHTGAVSSWVQLTGSVGPVSEDCVLEFVGDCDGSAGQVNFDDWTASVS